MYTTYAGEERQVAGQSNDPVLQLRDRSDATRLAECVAAEEVGDVVQVRVVAKWRGGNVFVSRMRGDDRVLVLTVDSALAEREGLSGNHYDGWGGVVLVTELEGVEEIVKVLKKWEGPS